MTKEQAERQAEKVIETVVNMIAERQYDKLSGITDLSGLSSEDVKELAEGFLERNDLNGIDRYDVACNFRPKYEYHQLNFYHYDNGSGFWADYDLTTDCELNDLTLQMEFLYDRENLKARLIDLHVM